MDCGSQGSTTCHPARPVPKPTPAPTSGAAGPRAGMAAVASPAPIAAGRPTVTPSAVPRRMCWACSGEASVAGETPVGLGAMPRRRASANRDLFSGESKPRLSPSSNASMLGTLISFQELLEFFVRHLFERLHGPIRPSLPRPWHSAAWKGLQRHRGNSPTQAVQCGLERI